MICKYCACDADAQKGWVEVDVEDCPDGDCDGHYSCKGCDCQHKPVGVGQIKSD